ncbi:unnamed protein product, partial [marine sediment metagenome]
MVLPRKGGHILYIPVLLDPIFGAAQCISHRVLPNNTGLLVSIEASGYSGEKEHRLTK